MNRCAACGGMQSHLIPKQQKASVLKVKRLYNDLTCVRSIWIKCALDSLFFFSPLPSYSFGATLLYSAIFMKRSNESDYIPSMLVSSPVGTSVALSVSDVSPSDLQFHHYVCLCLSSSWALAYLFCCIKHIAQWRLPVNAVVCLCLCALFLTNLS